MAGSGLIAPPTVALAPFLRMRRTGHIDCREPANSHQEADGGQGHSRAPKAREAEKQAHHTADNERLVVLKPTRTISGTWTPPCAGSLTYTWLAFGSDSGTCGGDPRTSAHVRTELIFLSGFTLQDIDVSPARDPKARRAQARSLAGRDCGAVPSTSIRRQHAREGHHSCASLATHPGQWRVRLGVGACGGRAGSTLPIRASARRLTLLAPEIVGCSARRQHRGAP